MVDASAGAAEMNTCGTCKHMGPRLTDSGGQDGAPYNDRPIDTKYGFCQVIVHLKGKTYGDDRIRKLSEQDAECLPGSLTAVAGVVDGSGYHAALCVSDEFGCNQWEA